MKQFRLIVFALGISVVYGQDYPAPTVNRNGVSVNDFVPKGWTLKDLTSGDLNKDSIPDLAFVIQQNDSIPSKDSDGFETKILPRILIIVFKTQEGQLTLKDLNKSMLVNTNFPPSSVDSFKSISIENGILIIDFFYDYINGNFYGYKYKFRFRSENFWLIGADVKYITRRNMDYEKRSFNFLTRKWNLIRGVYDNTVDPPKVKETTDWFDFDYKAMKAFSNFGRPGTWQVTKDEWI